jgi:DNA-binding beta-propeller fold protein YncE
MDVATEIPNTFNGQFFGIVSDTAIASIRFDEGTGGCCVETFDMEDARFVRFDSSVITTVADNLNFPFGVAVNNGDVYIADQLNNVVKKLSGATLTIVAGTGEAGYNGDNIPATTAQLSGPMGVGVANGNLLIADTGNHIIRKVNLSNGIITTVAGVPVTRGLAVNGVLAFNPSCGAAPAPPCPLLHTPTGVAGDGAGNIYIADSMNHQIRKVDGSGIITAVAGVAGETGNFDGPVSCTSLDCVPARLNQPLGVTLGSVYIVNQGSDNIRTVVNGAGGPEVTTVVAGTLNSPHGVAVDSSEGVILYIADTLNHRIQRVAGASITTVAGCPAALGLPCNETAGFSGDNGKASAAQLDTPTGVAVDSTGRFLYIADLKNNRIRRVDFNPPPPEP